MSYAAARPTGADSIPVVDIAPLRDGSDPIGVAKALHAANRGLGFVYVAGHGIPRESIAAARASAFEFFRRPERDKARFEVSARHRGWLRRGGAKMADDARADLKESFVWGWQDANGDAPEDHALRGANRWPDFVPGLEARAMAFYHQADRVARDLLAGFALGIGVERDLFLRHCARPLSRASFVYYPAQPEALGEDQFGVGPHTDFGVLTVLCQDDVGGLQVENADGHWIHAPPIDGTLVVNVGDLLMRWTDGVCRSTPHRVVNRSGRERLSLVLAFDPDPETPIDARDVHGPGYRAQLPAITCGDYLVERFARAFAYRGRAAHE